MSAAAGSKFKTFFNSPVGPKTIHFWAPLMKWALVVAGLGDLKRPIEQVSFSQQASLALSGFIWARWSTIITPRNLSLCAVNFFVGATSAVQLFRIAKHDMEQKKLKQAESHVAA
ncbi:Mitochondrial pyruvate carrier 2 [Smittium mucronatum]|uniref:Mitochondrial pyruvate carrier n=1 Tax=Smittium mucronatum TaxID=133383 RepID=A0A1R0GNT4_9FUNG|nr:Mitochondrial pyruvate carrier 2 [Smittium mucronatum]